MKTKLNNNHSNIAISWVGNQYEPPDDKHIKNMFVVFYRKCIVGSLTLTQGDYVLVSNMDSAEPDSILGCDVARIEHMYEILSDKACKDPYRAVVQWFSRPDALPKKLLQDENYVFNLDGTEVIQDSRFNPDISLETIFSLCKLDFIDEAAAAPNSKNYKISSKIPMYYARYKLVPIVGTKRMMLEPLVPSAKHSEITPRKRSIAERMKFNEKSSSPEIRRTPKLKLTRTKSVEFIDVGSMSHEEWIVKVVEDSDRSSYKKNVDILVNGVEGVSLGSGDDEGEAVSPVKCARRRSEKARRNLNDSLRNDDSDGEETNYSIVEDDDYSVPGTKIKLRLSQVSRKRRETSPIAEAKVSPSKTRKSIINNAVNHLESSPTRNGTPVTRRRKSILKMPSESSSDQVATPKRNIQLSNIIEECSVDRRISRRIDKKVTDEEEQEPRTPRSRRGRLSLTTSATNTATPKSAAKMKLIRSGALKPSIHERSSLPSSTLTQQGGDQFALARERLHVSAVPDSLPCREKEFTEIYNFLEAKILDRCGGCMYVSGVPGTGKTATVTAVIRSLRAQAEDDDDLPSFDYVELNGMRLTEPRQAYVHIYRQLTGKTLAWEQAYNLLDTRFTTKAPRRVTTVLLVDELDILCNKRQDVVYNLLNWPTIGVAQLVVITIANTMDLPERLLQGKIASRLGLTRLTFAPYNFRQLQEIVMARLVGTGSTFDADAVQLVARKVAAVSGDARRALDICRRATELAGSESVSGVSMIHVQRALGEMIASAKVQTIRSCSRLEQMFLQAVTAEVSRTGIEECSFLGVYAQFESLAAFEGIAVPNPGRAISICNRLGTSRLLICENSRNDIYQKILLNISADDVHYALQANSLI